MRIGILQTGHAPDELQADFGDYDRFFQRLLGEETFYYATFPVVDNVFPQSLDDADGWLITGSRFSVNDSDPWVSKLMDLIRKIKSSGKPMVGICFGHQAIAKALGGRVGDNPGGWVAGATQYEEKGSGDIRTLNAWHKEQVLDLPDGAEILAGSPECPYGIVRYGNDALTFQAHPEFNTPFVKELVRTRGQSLPDAIKERVAEQPDTGLSREKTADDITKFLKNR